MADEARRTVRRRRVAYGYDPRARYGYGGYEGAFSGLFRAATEAAAELLVGGSRVASTLLMDASDAMFGRRYVEDFENFEDFEDLEGAPAEAPPRRPGPPIGSGGSGRPARPVQPSATAQTEQVEQEFEDDEEVVVGYGPPMYGPSMYDPYCDSFNRAVQDGARVFSRSAERFAAEYDAYGRSRWQRPMRPMRPVRVQRRTTRTTTTESSQPAPTQPAPTVQPGPAAGTATPIPAPDLKPDLKK